MIFKYCAECGNKLEDIRCGDDNCRICPSLRRSEKRAGLDTEK